MKYAIIAVVLLAAYGISMAVMWSRYEPRDVHVEFPSDFREGLTKLVPHMTFSEMPPESIRESKMKTAEVSDPETFLALANRMPNNRKGSITATTVEIVKEINWKWKILVRYLYLMDVDSAYIEEGSILLSHSDSYDWPGRADEWTATNLNYEGGDFRFDNRDGLWFWTWFGIPTASLIWVLLALLFRKPEPKRLQ